MMDSIQQSRDGVTTVRLPKGHIRSASPARSSSTPASCSPREPAHLGQSPEATFPSPPVSHLLRGVGAIELLEQDDRPAFIIDLSSVDNFKPGQMQYVYLNPALRAAGNLRELLSFDTPLPTAQRGFSSVQRLGGQFDLQPGRKGIIRRWGASDVLRRTVMVMLHDTKPFAGR